MAYLVLAVIFIFLGIILVCFMSFFTALGVFLYNRKYFKEHPEDSKKKRKCITVMGFTAIPLVASTILVINISITATTYNYDFVECTAVTEVNDDNMVCEDGVKLVQTYITSTRGDTSVVKSAAYSVYYTGFNKCSSYNIFKTVIDDFDFYFTTPAEGDELRFYVNEKDREKIYSYYNTNSKWKNTPEELIPVFEKYLSLSDYTLEMNHSDFNYYAYNDSETLYPKYTGVNVHTDGTYLIYRCKYTAATETYKYYGIKLEGEDETVVRSYIEKNVKITCSEYKW